MTTTTSTTNLSTTYKHSDVYGSKLLTLKKGNIEEVSDLSFLNNKMVLNWYGASWCPPCTQLCGQLISMYNDLRKKGNNNFEIVFISSDNDDLSMRAFVKDMRMPWYVMPFDDSRAPLKKKYGVTGIPTLILVDANGEQVKSCPIRGNIDQVKACLTPPNTVVPETSTTPVNTK